VASLRELLLEIKIKSDKKEVDATNQAFNQATASAAKFESNVQTAIGGLVALRGEAQKTAAVVNKIATTPLRPPNAATPLRAENSALPDVAAPVAAKRSQKDIFAGALNEAKGKINGVLNSVTSLRAGVLAFGAAVVGNFVSKFVGDVISAGDALDDMSKRTRLSAESLQVWQKFISENAAGAGPEVLESSVRRLTRAMAQAGKGAKQPVAAFKDLGVAFKNSDGTLRPTEEVLIDVGSALAKMDDDAKAAALATQLLGNAGTALVPAFEGGADAVRKQTAAMRENVAMSSEEAAALGKLDDSLGRSASAWKVIKARIVIGLLPLITLLINGWEALSKKVRDIVRTTSILQTAFLMLSGGGLWKLVQIVGAFVTKAGGWRVVMSMMGQGLRAAASAAFRFLVPLLLIEDFLTFLAGGKSVFGRAFDEIFGGGGAVKARNEILAFFDQITAKWNTEIAPAIAQVWPILQQIGTVVGSVILGALNLIGMALSDNKDKTLELANAFLNNMAPAVEAVRDMLSSLGRGLNAVGLGSAAAGVFDAASSLDDKAASMRGAGKTIARNDSSNGVAESDLAARMAVFNARSMPPGLANNPAGAAAANPVAVQAGGRVVTLTDNRKIEVTVPASPSPGATGRAVGQGVSNALDQDRRQVLSGVQ